MVQDHLAHFEWWWMDMCLSIMQVSMHLQNVTDVRHYSACQWFSVSVQTQAFKMPSPALERLYVVWQKVLKKSCYTSFVPALEVGMQKLDQYYNCSAQSDAHIIAMGKFTILTWIVYWLCPGAVLDPRKKMGHFAKHWLEDLHGEVEDVVWTHVS